MAYFEKKFRNYSGVTKENHKPVWSGQLANVLKHRNNH